MPVKEEYTGLVHRGEPLDRFTHAYITAMMWAELDDDKPLDEEHEPSDISDEAMDKIVADCEKFQTEYADTYGIAASVGKYNVDQMAGHDFWLTRQGHGVGFWDRPDQWIEGTADKLTEAAKKFGELYPYVGDDGKIYF